MALTTSVTKRFEFNASHSLGPTYPGKCKNIHGHNYVVEVTVIADKLDEFGMVMDFGDMMSRFKGYCDEYLDHAHILAAGDEETKKWLIENGMKWFEMPSKEFYPTSSVENICRWLFNTFDGEMYSYPGYKERGARVEGVRVYETATSWAEVKWDFRP